MTFDDIYDATLIQEPEENDIEMEGDTACPVCGELVFPNLTDDLLDEAVDSPIAAPFTCPECGTDCEFRIEPLPIDTIGLGISVVRA